jgi:hypothetical protein
MANPCKLISGLFKSLFLVLWFMAALPVFAKASVISLHSVFSYTIHVYNELQSILCNCDTFTSKIQVQLIHLTQNILQQCSWCINDTSVGIVNASLANLHEHSHIPGNLECAIISGDVPKLECDDQMMVF